MTIRQEEGECIVKLEILSMERGTCPIAHCCVLFCIKTFFL